MGILFNYQSVSRYYRFSIDGLNNIISLSKIIDGASELITYQDFAYQKFKTYDVVIYSTNDRIIVHVNQKRIFDVVDSSIKSGSIAFYSYHNPLTYFDNLSISGTSVINGISPNASRILRSFFFLDSKPGVLFWKIDEQSSAEYVELSRISPEKSEIIKSWQLVGENNVITEAYYYDPQYQLADKYHLKVFDSEHVIIDQEIIDAYTTNATHTYVSDFYPNPATNTTNFSVYSEQPAVLEYQIYNILGEKVLQMKQLLTGRSSSEYSWNGLESSGRAVASGTYFMKVTIRDNNVNSRIILQDLKKILIIR